MAGAQCCEQFFATPGAPPLFVIDTERQCSDRNCSDAESRRYHMKAVIHYEDATPTTRGLGGGSSGIKVAPNLDCTQPFQEYIVPRCADGTPADKCVHVQSCVRPLNPTISGGQWSTSTEEMPQHLELHQAKPHLHTGAISIKLEDALTNETLCYLGRDNGGVLYGTSTEAGNERDYIVAAPNMCVGRGPHAASPAGAALRITGVYDASRQQNGAMVQWLLMVAAAEQQARPSRGSASR